MQVLYITDYSPSCAVATSDMCSGRRRNRFTGELPGLPRLPSHPQPTDTNTHQWKEAKGGEKGCQSSHCSLSHSRQQEIKTLAVHVDGYFTVCLHQVQAV